MSNQVEELRGLKDLFDQGALTQEEYDIKKAAILGEVTGIEDPLSSDRDLLLDSKRNVPAALFAIYLGTLGIHKFYLGYASAGVTMLLVTLVGFFLAFFGFAFPPLLLFALGPIVIGIIAFIEAIIYLMKTDRQFYEIYVVGRKQWF